MGKSLLDGVILAVGRSCAAGCLSASVGRCFCCA